MLRFQRSPVYPWVVIGNFTLSFSVIIVAISSLGLMLPQISEELDLSPSQQGWLGSSVLFANVLFAIPLNLWLSKYRPWITATASFLGASLFLTFNAWAPTFLTLLIARVGLGVLQQSTQAPRTLVIIHWVPRNRIGLANGFSIGIVDILMGLGFISIPLMMEWVGGWRNTLYTWAGICLATSILWMLVGRDRPSAAPREQARSQTERPPIGILKSREVWLVGLAVFGVLMGRMAFSNFWPTYVQDEYGLKITTAGFMFGAVSLTMAVFEVGLIAIPYFKRHRSAVLVSCSAGMCLSHLGLLSTGSVPLLFLLSMANGAAFGFFPILLTLLFELPEIKPREVAVATSFMSSTMWLGGAIGPILVGFVQEISDDLGLGLLIASFAPITLAIAGLRLSDGGRRDTLVKPVTLKENDDGAEAVRFEGQPKPASVPQGKRL